MFISGDANINDELLLLHLREGNKDAFKSLYNKYWKLVYTSAYKRLQDEDLAKDVTQDIFLQLWARRELLEIRNIAAYLHTSVRNKVYNVFEAERKFSPVLDLFASLASNGDQADSELIKKEFMIAYEQLVAKLPPTQKRAFQMRFNEGLTTEDIAKELNVSRKTVQNNLSSAVGHLRSSLTAIALLLISIKH